MATQTPEDIKESFSDLDFTRGMRKRIVTVIGDEALKNKDPELLRTTMQALDGIDKGAMGRLKLNEKDKENANSASEAEALTNLLLHLSDRNRTPPPVSDRGNDTRDQKLPADQRPVYDPTVRDSASTGENTGDFKDRIERTLPKRQ